MNARRAADRLKVAVADARLDEAPNSTSRRPGARGLLPPVRYAAGKLASPVRRAPSICNRRTERSI